MINLVFPFSPLLCFLNFSYNLLIFILLSLHPTCCSSQCNTVICLLSCRYTVEGEKWLNDLLDHRVYSMAVHSPDLTVLYLSPCLQKDFNESSTTQSNLLSLKISTFRVRTSPCILIISVACL